MIHILGILAKAGHGKTTIANHLRDVYDARVISLGTPLKRVAATVMGFSDEQLYGTQAQKEAIDPRYGFSARTFLQRLGTDGLREEFWPDIHLRKLVERAERDNEETPHDLVHAVDDVRFPNEGMFIADPPYEGHGAVIKLVCTDAPSIEGSAHASEASIDAFPEEALAGTVISSRAQGTEHLIRQFTKVLEGTPRLRPFLRVLNEGAYRRAKAA